MTINTLKKIKPFSPTWWKGFLKTTEKFSKTTVFKNCISPTEIDTMRVHFMEILRVLANLRTDTFGYRVYVEGKMPRGTAMKEIYDTPPLDGENVTDWAKRLFGDKKFGLIINRGEKFNAELAKIIALKIKPLLEKVGIPMTGINLTLFVGNYGYTPIGIHTDERGENVIHFHLGPGPKTMYTWDKETYESLVGKDVYNNKDVDPLIPHANQFPFETGDLYSMPWHQFHIGKSEELSVGISLWFNNPTKNKLAQKTLKIITDQYLQESIDIIPPDNNPLADLGNIDQAVALYDFPKDLEDLNFRDFIKMGYRDFRYSLYSNSGFWTKPLDRDCGASFAPTDTIRLEDPFPILYLTSRNEESLYLYIRGTKVEVKNFDCIREMIDLLNERKSLKTKELLAVLDPSWPEEMGEYLLNLLYQHNGIQKET